MQNLQQAGGFSDRHRLKLLQPADRTATEPIPATTLWLALYIPRLALHAVADNKGASAVVEISAGRPLVVAVNQAGADQSITNGMTASAALSLCHRLTLYERDLAAECALLNKVAAIAYQFSDRVVLYTANSIALEIYGSLKLFGGPAALKKALQQRLQALGLQFVSAIAPTARAANWLAVCSKAKHVHNLPALKTSLRQLPAELIADDIKMIRQFQNCGIQTLEDYMRLPRKDANRRFGLQPLKLLQQALGEQTELLQYYKPPELFSAEWVFDEPVTVCTQIEKAAESLLQKLQHYLTARCAAIQYFVLLLRYTDQSNSVLRIGSSHYQRNAAHLKKLLHDRLRNQVIEQPVTAVRLQADKPHILPAANIDFFAAHHNDQQAWQQLLDLLQTRLGQHAILSLSTYDDPRPEHAYRFNSVQRAADCQHSGWPLWLLEKPLALNIDQLIKKLKPAEHNAERIEQGWWDGKDVRRDYYCIRNDKGARHWIFQDCRTKQWFLHGLFG